MPELMTIPVINITGNWSFDYYFTLVTVCAYVGYGIGMVVRIVSRS